MTHDPLVSIVLPTYNGSRYLAESIQSCIDQTYRNWELIIVDDASTDDTPAIIGRYVSQDPRISSVRHDANRRIPGGLNTGFARSRGEYLTWTSDDNLYEPDALDRMVRYLEAEPAMGMVYCDEKTIGQDGETIGQYLKKGPEALPDHCCVGACFLYRRRVYEAVGEYDPGMFLVEDYDYWLRISRQFPIGHLGGMTPYKYRVHPGSLSFNRYAEQAIQIARTKCRHVVPPAQQRQVMLKGYWQALWVYRKGGDLRGAWYCARKCLSLAPWRFLHVKAAIGTGLRLLASGQHRARTSPNRVFN